MRIAADHLVKRYGSKESVSDLSFTLEHNCILGFIGPNGAGKTTTMRMLCGIMSPSSGQVFINGMELLADPVRAKQQIGYLPENAPLHGSMTVRSFLHYCASMRGMGGKQRTFAMDRVMESCSLRTVADEEIEALSKGYRRRVCLAQSILHEPGILVLDEPTDGLDPNQKREIRALIKTMRERCAIIVSTHILEEVDAVCDRVLTISAGRKVFDGDVAEFRAVSGGSLEDSFAKLAGEDGQ
ncbi:MAG: putative ABC transporter ATP-binding protein YbhF [Lentisphaerae bacterium ADurb.Bin242]|nr:MAG: putative ABC transporter ATP-binding protein YbhF [Lentisphaerae bacterium ADurb.Bin242]